jgi:hypothetical protein
VFIKGNLRFGRASLPCYTRYNRYKSLSGR